MMKERVKMIMETFQLTNVAFAEAVGLKESTVRAILTGKTQKISGNVLLMIMEKYNVNPVWLIKGEGNVFIDAGINEPPPLITRKEILPPPPANRGKEKTSPPVEPQCQVKAAPECLESINGDNIHQTRWFQELSRDRQFVVSTCNTPSIPELTISRMAAAIHGGEDHKEDHELYQKGAAG